MSGGISVAKSSTLRIVFYDEGENGSRYSVWGGPDDDTYVADFQDEAAAESFILWSKIYNRRWRGVRGSP